MSLPYFLENNWKATVVAVNEKYSTAPQDKLLQESIPEGVEIYKVKAFPRHLTSKLGLGSIALRALYYYHKCVTALLKGERYDLVYFSTTQFPVCVLGAYWKRRFKIPYVIDMQDPWHSDYYQERPRSLRPPKYWFSYRLNKFLEPVAMQEANGLISVSGHYLAALRKRYPTLAKVPVSIIPFGAFPTDMKIAAKHADDFHRLLPAECINMVYIGRGGADMHQAIAPLFSALKACLENFPMLFNKFRVHFIGTSYAPPGTGNKTILPFAENYNLAGYVTEVTDRLSFYHTLVTLQQADALFIPGSDDPAYSASKLFPYLSSGKPMMAIFHQDSPALHLLHEFGAPEAYAFQTLEKDLVMRFLVKLATGDIVPPSYDPSAMNKYTAARLTQEQCKLFDIVLASG